MSTKPVPADRDAPVARTRSDLAALALAAGVDPEDVRAYAAARSVQEFGHTAEV